MKQKPILNKIAAILAFVIGAMAIFAGGQVILGILPDYYVIDWLPIFNFVVGFVSVFFTAVVIWKDTSLSWPSAIATFSVQAIVMIVLQTAYRGVVAPDSIKATTVRLIIWLIILILLFVQQEKNKKQGDSK